MPKQKKKNTATPNSVTTVHVVPRNPFSDHPLMRKGGVHQKTKSAERSQTRRETKRLARDWSSNSHHQDSI